MPLLETRASGSALAYGLSAFQELGAIELIQTVSGGNAYFEFTNIPQNYKHLRLFFFARGTGTGTVDNTNVIVNNSNGNSYIQNQMYTDTGGSRGTGGAINPTGPSAFMNYPTGGAPSNYYGSGVVDFSDYTNPNKYKTFHIWTGTEANSTASGAYYIIMRSQLFISLDPVTSLKFTGGSSFTSDSYMSLYGIKG
jgi:hypothetical protein